MSINLTIIGQFITFAILVWFTMKYVWPPVIKTIHDREKKIAAGLEAAEQGQHELQEAAHKSLTIIREAKQQATQIIEQATVHSGQIIEEAKILAKQEAQRVIELAQTEIDREVNKAKEALKGQLATLAIAGAEKIIKRDINPAALDDLLDDLAAGM